MRRFLWIVLLAASGMSAFAAGDTLPLRRLGLYIGSNNGGQGRVTLRYAEEDARAMAGVMQELGGIAGEDSLVLLAPTAEDVQSGFRQARQRAQAVRESSRRVELLVYYSGHSDEQGLLLGEQRFGYAELKEAIQEVRADVNIAILDSCSSGAFTRLKGGTRQPPFLLDESSSMQGHAYISSSSAEEAAQESDLIKGSFFTYFLISGLRGAADSTRDGQVSLNEAYHFAFNETLALTENTQGGAQHPSYNIQLTGTGDLTLTDLRAAACTLNFAESVQGRLFVRSASGRLVAELAKESGGAVGLGLPEGQYRVILEEGQQLYEATADVRPGRELTLGPRQFSPVKRRPTVTRGEGGQGAEGSPEDDLLLEGTLDPEQGFWQRAEKWFNRKNALPAPSTGASPSGAPAPKGGFFNPALPPSEPAAPRGPSSPQSGRPSTAEPAPAFPTAPPEPAEPPAPEVSSEPFALGVLPTVSTAGPGRHVHALSLNLLAGSSWAIHGAELGAVLNFTEHEVRGAQMAGVGNILGGELTGYQAAGVFNIVAGDSRAYQAAGVFNLVQGEAGFLQAAGVFNIGQGAFRGLEAAGVFNLGPGPVSGLQAAGVFNLLDGPLSGAQLAGVFNRASEVAGAQVGLVNISGDVRGGQVGLVNVATGEVWGGQVGLVNISRRMHGLPVGLVSISENGGFSLSGWVTDDGFGYVSLQMSSGLLYTVLYGGTLLAPSPSVYAAGLGLGLHVPVGVFYAELDLGVQQPFEPASPYLPPFPTARLLVGWTVFRSLGLFGGVLLNGHIPGSTQLTPLHTGVPLDLQFAGGSLELYPKLILGLRI
jgi:hypothetical protein